MQTAATLHDLETNCVALDLAHQEPETLMLLHARLFCRFDMKL